VKWSTVEQQKQADCGPRRQYIAHCNLDESLLRQTFGDAKEEEAHTQFQYPHRSSVAQPASYKTLGPKYSRRQCFAADVLPLHIRHAGIGPFGDEDDDIGHGYLDGVKGLSECERSIADASRSHSRRLLIFRALN